MDEQGRRCPSCGEPWTTSTRFCPACGALGAEHTGAGDTVGEVARYRARASVPVPSQIATPPAAAPTSPAYTPGAPTSPAPISPAPTDADPAYTTPESSFGDTTGPDSPASAVGRATAPTSTSAPVDASAYRSGSRTYRAGAFDSPAAEPSFGEREPGGDESPFPRSAFGVPATEPPSPADERSFGAPDAVDVPWSAAHADPSDGGFALPRRSASDDWRAPDTGTPRIEWADAAGSGGSWSAFGQATADEGSSAGDPFAPAGDAPSDFAPPRTGEEAPVPDPIQPADVPPLPRRIAGQAALSVQVSPDVEPGTDEPRSPSGFSAPSLSWSPMASASEEPSASAAFPTSPADAPAWASAPPSDTRSPWESEPSAETPSTWGSEPAPETASAWGSAPPADTPAWASTPPADTPSRWESTESPGWTSEQPPADPVPEPAERQVTRASASVPGSARLTAADLAGAPPIGTPTPGTYRATTSREPVEPPEPAEPPQPVEPPQPPEPPEPAEPRKPVEPPHPVEPPPPSPGPLPPPIPQPSPPFPEPSPVPQPPTPTPRPPMPDPYPEPTPYPPTPPPPTPPQPTPPGPTPTPPPFPPPPPVVGGVRGVATPGTQVAPPPDWAATPRGGTPTEYGAGRAAGTAAGQYPGAPTAPADPYAGAGASPGDPYAGRSTSPGDAERAPRRPVWQPASPGEAPTGGAQVRPDWRSTLVEQPSWPSPADPPAQRRGGSQPYPPGMEPPSGPEVSGSLTGHILAQGRPDIPETPSDGTRIMIALLIGLGVLVIGGLAVAIFAGDSFTRLLASFFSG